MHQDKLLLLNSLSNNTFGKASLVKLSMNYFQKTKWNIQYIDKNWESILPKIKVVFLWFQQQVDPKIKLNKGVVLNKLLAYQKKYNYIILDYIEDVHRSHKSFGVSLLSYKRGFTKEPRTKNYMIVRYENAIKKLYPMCNYYCLPFSINSTIIPKFNKDPIPKILITGRLKQKNYPLRKKLADLSHKYEIDILDHPTYKKLNHNFVGKKYLQKINQYLVSVSTCGDKRFNYVVAKYFEIPASGALLFAYIEPVKDLLNKYGFKDGINMVSFTENNMEDKIKYVLSPINREEINKIRLNGYKLIKNKHTHGKRFHNELNSFISSL